MVFFARTNFRSERRTFGIKRADRRAAMYVIGKTGTGKSTLLETLITQDIAHGEGVALLDPHGDLAEKVLLSIPERRKGDLLYFDPVAAQPLGIQSVGEMCRRFEGRWPQPDSSKSSRKSGQIPGGRAWSTS